MANLLEFSDATIGYGRHAVLEHVSFQLETGTFAGLLGANGSGKTTLLKTIAGILPPQRGHVLLRRADGRRPVIGYVPQRESLDPLFLFNSLQVVLMGALGRVGPGRLLPTAEKQRAHQCLEHTGAANLARLPFAKLSGGQKQRVLVARALMTAPDLLLLDEPTSGLDATAAAAVLELLGQLHAEGNLTVLMVSHDLAAVRRHVREVIWIHQGRLVHGSPETLLTRDRIDELLNLQLP